MAARVQVVSAGATARPAVGDAVVFDGIVLPALQLPFTFRPARPLSDELGWLIDPARTLAMIYTHGAEPRTLLSPEFLEGSGPIAGFRIEMREFWQ
jgi:hypothetical protein